MKRNTCRNYLITMGIGLLIAASVTGIQGGFTATDQQALMGALCDGCFVAGALLTGAGLLVFVADDGFFDLMNYGVQKVLRLVLSEQKQAAFPKTFFEFRQIKNASRKGSTAFLLLSGLVWIALAALWLGLYGVG